MYNHPYRRPIIDVKPQQKKPKVPPPKPWIQIANVELYDYDKQALLSPVGWLTDSLVNVAQQLLKKQFSTIQSLQDVAVSYTMNFEIQIRLLTCINFPIKLELGRRPGPYFLSFNNCRRAEISRVYSPNEVTVVRYKRSLTWYKKRVVGRILLPMIILEKNGGNSLS